MKKQRKNHLLEIKDKNIFSEVKELLDPKSYVECDTCGAVKVDAMELAKVLNFLSEKYGERFDKSDDDEDDEKSCFLHDILWKIVEYGPEFGAGIDWEKWDRENQQRYCDFLGDYGCEVYIAYPEVVLFPDKQCECLNVWGADRQG